MARTHPGGGFMTSAVPHEDPYYLDDPARWYRQSVERYNGIRIVIEDTLYPQEVAASRKEKIIWITPGLPFTEFRKYISDAVAFIKFGEEWAPMFAPAPHKPWLAASDGVTRARPA